MLRSTCMHGRARMEVRSAHVQGRLTAGITRSRPAIFCLVLGPGADMKWQCRLEVALSGGPWAMLRAPGPGPAAYDVRGRFAADAPRADFGSASRALTLRDVASACHKRVRVASLEFRE